MNTFRTFCVDDSLSASGTKTALPGCGEYRLIAVAAVRWSQYERGRCPDGTLVLEGHDRWDVLQHTEATLVPDDELPEGLKAAFKKYIPYGTTGIEGGYIG